jgi:hypothetical protein
MFWRAKLAEFFWCVEGDTIPVLLTASDSRYDKDTYLQLRSNTNSEL